MSSLQRSPLLLLCVLLAMPSSAQADSKGARVWFDKATAAYALGDYAEAATDYEKAYSEKPDRALLYNAAQSHRSAGNKARALLLYKNYLRIYPSATNRAETEEHITALESAIAADDAAAKHAAEPVVVAPVVVTEPAHVEMPSTNAALVATIPPKRPLYKKGWFWGAIVGGAVVVGVAVGVGLAFGLPPKTPTASFGKVAGN